MTSKRQPVAINTKLQALDQVDKKWNLKLKLLKNMAFCVAHCQHTWRTRMPWECGNKRWKELLFFIIQSETRNTFAPCLPFMAKDETIHIIKQGYFHYLSLMHQQLISDAYMAPTFEN